GSGRSGHISFNYDIEFLNHTLLDLSMEVFQCYLLQRAHLGASLLCLSNLRYLSGFALLLDDGESLARKRNAGKTDNLGRHGWSCALDSFTFIIDESPHLSELGSSHEEVTYFQRA